MEADVLAITQVFLNIVLDDAVEEKDGGEKVKLGMVVCSIPPFLTPKPGNSLITRCRSSVATPLSC
jgi:hypothetical protein